MKALLVLAIVVALLVGIVEPRRRRRDRVAAVWADETDRP